ncbi:MAG: hypothetical protein M1820_002120 [Bogoriella megaspora]|nr:MAG: hypothetical protein M1820_002120 [Bogoriella megaspora]
MQDIKLTAPCTNKHLVNISFGSIWQQFFPQAATFTEKDIPAGSQAGKVFIVTGANSGIGFELVKILYPTAATIYLAGRSEERVKNAIAQITSITPNPDTPATLKYLHLDLSDLDTVKAAAATFASQETELRILWNNAGAGYPKGSSTKQGIEAHAGANCVAPLLFTQLLLPFLKVAAQNSPRNIVRIVWTSSLQIEMSAPKDGINYERFNSGATVDKIPEYAASKAGNLFLADEGAKIWGKDGIAKFGTYTMLFAGFSPEVTLDVNGAYICPWEKIQLNGRVDMYRAIEAGKAREFWEWCEDKYRPFA